MTGTRFGHWVAFTALALVICANSAAAQAGTTAGSEESVDKVELTFGFGLEGQIVRELPDRILMVVKDRIAVVQKADIAKAYLAIANPEYLPPGNPDRKAGELPYLLMPVVFPPDRVSDVLDAREGTGDEEVLGAITFHSEGQVTIRHGEAEATLLGTEPEAMLLRGGDAVQTMGGGRLRATFEDGLQLVVEANSNVRFNSTEVGNTTLTCEGAAAVSVDKGEYFEILAGSWRILSEGARVVFSYTPEPESVRVEVSRGSVHVSRENGMGLWLSQGQVAEVRQEPLRGRWEVRATGRTPGMIVVPTGDADGLRVLMAPNRSVQFAGVEMLDVAAPAPEMGDGDDADDAGEEESAPDEATAPQGLPHAIVHFDNGARISALANGTFWFEMAAKGNPVAYFRQGGWLSITPNLHVTLTADPEPVAILPGSGSGFVLRPGVGVTLPAQEIQYQLPRVAELSEGAMARIRLVSGSASYRTGGETRTLTAGEEFDASELGQLSSEMASSGIVFMPDGTELIFEADTVLTLETTSQGNTGSVLEKGTVRVRKGGYFHLQLADNGLLSSEAAETVVRLFDDLVIVECVLGQIYLEYEGAAGWVPAGQSLRLAADPAVEGRLVMQTLGSDSQLVALLPKKDAPDLVVGLTGKTLVARHLVEYSDRVVVLEFPDEVWLRVRTDLVATLRREPGGQLWAVFPGGGWLKFPEGFKATLRPDEAGRPEVVLPSGASFTPGPKLKGATIAPR